MPILVFKYFKFCFLKTTQKEIVYMCLIALIFNPKLHRYHLFYKLFTNYFQSNKIQLQLSVEKLQAQIVVDYDWISLLEPSFPLLRQCSSSQQEVQGAPTFSVQLPNGYVPTTVLVKLSYWYTNVKILYLIFDKTAEWQPDYIIKARS